MTTTTSETTTLAEVDKQFRQLACLGHGGFASVFLARKRSGRKVALKFTRFDLDCDVQEEQESFTREVDAVLKLECTPHDNTSSQQQQRPDLSIVFFEDWFHSPGKFACIVMNYANGGTLAQEIEAKAAAPAGEFQPYAERRIAWYALQLSEALAHAHTRGVAHHDVKSSNVLIDQTGGGKLLLADFGSSVAPGEESHKFTEIYSSPELQLAHERGDYSGLQADKIDAFGLGCIIFELVCCKKLVDLTAEQTLSEYIQEKQSAEAALNLPCLRLPFLPETVHDPSVAGYSFALKSFLKSLLELHPQNRLTPTELQKPLRNDPRSPLVADFVPAAQTPIPGAPVTIDNIQLGLFVQRGRDWDDGEEDGGLSSVGCVARLDDGFYAMAAFPSPLVNHRSGKTSIEPASPLLCRIGAGNKFELQVGPTPLNDFYGGTEKPKVGGVIYSSDTTKYGIGQKINPNCVVVGVHTDHILVAPLEKIPIPTLPINLPEPFRLEPNPRKPLTIPESWTAGLKFQEVEDGDERQRIISLFFHERHGLDIQAYEIVSIQRFQSQELWMEYANTREQVAAQNWGLPNDMRLFHGSGPTLLDAQGFSPDRFYETCRNLRRPEFSPRAQYGNLTCYKARGTDIRVTILSRVVLGRVDEGGERLPFPVDYHSKYSPHETYDIGSVYTVSNIQQTYPEYVISYKPLTTSTRRVIRARRPGERRATQTSTMPRRPLVTNSSPQNGTNPPFSSPPPRSEQPAFVPSIAMLPSITARANPEQDSTVKQCVVCLERPACFVLVPCGHPNLCEICSSSQSLSRLKRKCPECRQKIKQAIRLYGKIAAEG